jgi:hypothetical protein
MVPLLDSVMSAWVPGGKTSGKIKNKHFCIRLGIGRQQMLSGRSLHHFFIYGYDYA